ncbi:MAG: hypothetical protein AB7D37_19300 [Desulfovibrio sp.]
MRRWLHRHPRAGLIVAIALLPLGLLDVVRIVGLACRDAYATAKDETSSLAREWRDLFSCLWREAFPPKEA